MRMHRFTINIVLILLLYVILAAYLSVTNGYLTPSRLGQSNHRSIAKSSQNTFDKAKILKEDIGKPQVFSASALSMKIISDDDVLALVERTDKGTAASKEERLAIATWFNETSGKYQALDPSPLDDDLLYGNFDVSYVDGGKSQSGNPAGGKLFRGAIGRILYRNEGLFQHILRDPTSSDRSIAVNYIKGKLFNFIPLAVILKGVITRLSDEDRLKYVNKYNNPLSPTGTVRADFEPPIVAFGDPLKDKKKVFSMRVGPGSYVVLDTPYLTPKLRLGLGSKGSIFVFKRTDDPVADTWKDYLAITPVIASKFGLKVLAAGAFCAIGSDFLAKGFPRVFSNPFVSLLKRFVKSFSTLVAIVGLFLSVSRGGIERDEFALDVSKGL